MFMADLKLLNYAFNSNIMSDLCSYFYRML